MIDLCAILIGEGVLQGCLRGEKMRMASLMTGFYRSLVGC